MEPAKFLLLTTHRSGTRLLLDALKGTLKIKCHKRVFALTVLFERFTFDRLNSPFYRFRSLSVKRRFDYFFRKQQLVDDFMTALYRPTAQVEAIGVRVIYDQVDKHPEILEWAGANNIGVIHLIRKNFLQTVAHTEASLERGLVTSSSRAEPAPTIHLPPARLIMQLSRLAGQIEKYRALLKDDRYLELYYESLLANGPLEIGRVLTFFELDQRPGRSVDPVKAHAGSPEKIIGNYEEVKHSLSGTPFERFLN